MQRLKKSEPQPCVEWPGSKDAGGYGRLWVHGKYVRAHRVALALHLGVDVKSLGVVRHTCDNPGCVNVQHLLNGTIADNNRDRAERGRSSPLRVDRRKLTYEDAEAIRTVYVPRSRAYGTRALARVYGVTSCVITKIIQGRTYTCSG